VRLCASVYVCVYVCVGVCVYVCVAVCVRMCVCVLSQWVRVDTFEQDCVCTSM